MRPETHPEVRPEKRPEVRQKIRPKTRTEITSALLRVIVSNPKVTRNELALFLNRSPDSIKHNLAQLVRKGVIKREGSDRAGKWVIFVK